MVSSRDAASPSLLLDFESVPLATLSDVVFLLACFIRCVLITFCRFDRLCFVLYLYKKAATYFEELEY